MLVLLALSGCAPSGGPLPDGPLPAGVWGQGSDGDGLLLTVADDATAHLDNGCWGGDLPAIDVVDSTIDVAFTYVLRALGGDEVPAVLAGSIDGDTLTATLSREDSPDQDVVLERGHVVELYECP